MAIDLSACVPAQADDGGAAYPFPIHDSEGQISANAKTGMTLLDHFAGLAMVAMLDRHINMPTTEIGTSEAKLPHPPSLARWSYEYAIAMVEEKRRLEKENTDGGK